uniref:Putative ionotropic glutamate receptor kainate-like 6 n=1 Tax=Hirudo verbana TaxID=311461 RepID=A0A2S1WM19_9ANNE|nr:putative ionotropic glutamate receptor kainate-like 6 [Hirudo verbana]
MTSHLNSRSQLSSCRRMRRRRGSLPPLPGAASVAIRCEERHHQRHRHRRHHLQSNFFVHLLFAFSFIPRSFQQFPRPTEVHPFMPYRVSLGLISDNNSEVIQDAFRMEVERKNNFSSTFITFDQYEMRLESAEDRSFLKAMCLSIGKDVIAVFGGISSTPRNALLRSLSEQFKMPLVTVLEPDRRYWREYNNVPTNTTIDGHMVVVHNRPPVRKFQEAKSGDNNLNGIINKPNNSHNNNNNNNNNNNAISPSLNIISDHDEYIKPSEENSADADFDYTGDGGRGGPYHIDHTEQATSKGSSKQLSHAFFVRPVFHKAILDMIVAYKWTSVYYVFDSIEGLSRVEYLHSRMNRGKVRVDITLLRVRNPLKCHVFLRQLDSRRTTGDKYIVVDVSTTRALQAIIRQIQSVGMNRATYHYLLHTLNFDELHLEDFRHGGSNITGFRLVDWNSPVTSEALSQWQTRLKISERKFTLDAALTIDAVSVLVSGLHNAVQRNTKPFAKVNTRSQSTTSSCRLSKSRISLTDPTILESFHKVNFSGVTGYVSFDNRGYRLNYTLSIVEQRLDREPIKIGTWHSTQGIMFDTTSGFNYTAELLHLNRTRVVTSIESQPYLFIKKPGDIAGLGAEYEGYCVDLTKEIAHLVGFDYKIQLVADGKYGEKMANGTWNGMVGELTRKEADVAVAPLTITSIRERVIDFSKPFMNLGISIMIKKPEKQKPGVFSFMDPLSYKIWMCIIFSYLGVSTVLFFVSRFSPNEWQIEDSVHGPTYVNDFTILNSLWFALGAFMRRGCEVCPRSLSGRIVGSAWWFFTLIIISSYTANLAAFLTIERMLTPIKNADDLAKQTEILYGTLDGGSTQTFFRTSKIQVYEKMWNFMSSRPSVFVKKTEEGIARVRNLKGKYAFLVESTMNDYANQRKPCNTMKVGDNLDSKGYGVATYLGSDLREQINVAVLQLLEREFLQKLQKKWWVVAPPRAPCP